MTTTLDAPVPLAATPAPVMRPPGGMTAELVVLENVSWELYEQLLAETDGQHIRITYDEGRMVLRSPLQPHEYLTTALGRMIEQAVIELDIPCLALGSTTWRRKKLRKGLEPDECNYIQHEPVVRSNKKIDLDRDPPPDLTVEVDVTNHPAGRESVYAALGVNEIWKHNGESLVFLKRGADGQYVPIDRSEALPMLTSTVVNEWLGRLDAMPQTQFYRAFRDWLRTLPETR